MNMNDINKKKIRLQRDLELKKIGLLSKSIARDLAESTDKQLQLNEVQHRELSELLLNIQESFGNLQEEQRESNETLKSLRDTEKITSSLESLASAMGLGLSDLRLEASAISEGISEQNRTLGLVRSDSKRTLGLLGVVKDFLGETLNWKILERIADLIGRAVEYLDNLKDPESKSIPVTVVNQVTPVSGGGGGIIPFATEENVTKKALLDSEGRLFINGSGNLSATGSTLFNVSITNANTEYSQSIPAQTKKFTLQLRDSEDLRFAFEGGKVAGPSSPYFTVKAGQIYYEDGLLDLSGATVSLASGVSGVVAELICWV